MPLSRQPTNANNVKGAEEKEVLSSIGHELWNTSAVRQQSNLAGAMKSRTDVLLLALSCSWYLKISHPSRILVARDNMFSSALRKLIEKGPKGRSSVQIQMDIFHQNQDDRHEAADIIRNISSPMSASICRPTNCKLAKSPSKVRSLGCTASYSNLILAWESCS